ncbi:protein-histidine kinase [Gigaspora margarita]|uniref:Protein-histidine kinase n=1 Tax=Gigaspora margarita TaxID=4874 RepID=A0A8H4B4W7_GIGMA|nr:protein-histidine kinase [Gigaspora margarita]
MSLPSIHGGNIKNKQTFINTVYNYDWSSTPLGPMDSWDPAFKNAVNLCLQTAFPSVIYTGPGWIQIYNEAYESVLMTKQHALGKPFNEVWPEIYEYSAAQFEGVKRTGKGHFKKDELYLLERDGYIEEAYFNYTCSPIFISDGSVCGAFCIVQETTQKVLSARRLKILGEFGRRITEAESLESACNIITKILGDNNADIPYAMIYLVDRKLNTPSESLIARLITTTFDYDSISGWLFPDNLPETPEIIELTKDVDKNYNTFIEIKREAATYSFLKCDSWPIHLLIKEGDHIKVILNDGSQAVLLLTKISLSEDQVLSAILICGINRRRTLDEKYMEFLKLITNHMNTCLLHARSIEEEKKRSKSLTELNRQNTLFFQGISHELKTPLTLMLSPLDDIINACPQEASIMSYLQIIRPDEESKIKGLDNGADDYLIKPFSARELITRIRANIELSHIRRKILFQQYKQEETKQLLLTISNKILSGLNINETLLDIIKEIHHKLPSERILIISNDQSEFKNNKIIASYNGSESTPSTNNLFNETNNKSKSSEFLNNNSGVDIYLDVYCDDICKNASVLSVEISLNNICWGWIKLYRSPNSIWLDSEIELLQQISNQISLIVTRVNILKENVEKDVKIKAVEFANKAKSQILANTSHELRTPLGAIVGILSSFENTSLNTDQRDMINIMAHASDIVLSIVNDILDAAKLEAGKVTLTNRTFDLLELFEDTIEKYGKRAGTKKIDFIVNCEIDSFPRYVKSDPDRVKQVLSHLLSNSVKFTDKGKIVLTISIRLQEVIDNDKERPTYGQMVQRGCLLIELYDTGIGIDPEYIKHAWQSFSQGDMSITKMQDGTGLGLSICKHLVEINGGEIKVESELGKGSKFWFTWNVELLSSTTSSLSTQFDRMSYALPQSIKQKRILIIHSVEDARNAMLNYLKKIDKVYAFDTFDKGIRAAKKYKELNNQFAYDIVFISLYDTNEDEIMKAIFELRELDTNNDNLVIIFIVFPTNEENELAEKLIGKIGGTITILYTPITWKKIVNLFMNMEKNYVAMEKNYVVIENIFKYKDYRFIKSEDTNHDLYEGIKENDSKSKCILCVDDNYISLENTLRQVSKLGYSTISASNGLEAINLIDSKFSSLSDKYSNSFYSNMDQLKSRKISLILTECNLPMMSGFDVSQAVRAMKPPISDTPIVVLTALPMREIRNKCIESGANDYLAKPLKIEELEKILTKWISEN